MVPLLSSCVPDLKFGLEKIDNIGDKLEIQYSMLLLSSSIIYVSSSGEP